MKVALTQRIMRSTSGYEIGDGLAGAWLQWLQSANFKFIPIPVPNDPELVRNWLEVVSPQAMILTGGEDFGTVAKRDETEMRIIEESAGKIPILGVCRGAQVLNHWMFGKNSKQETAGHVALNHYVQIDDPLVAQKIGNHQILVNSFHHNVIKRHELASMAQVLASHSDGTIEAFLHPELRLMGIQWHPERPIGGGREFSHYVQEFLAGSIL